MWTPWIKPDRNDDPQREQCNRCKQSGSPPGLSINDSCTSTHFRRHDQCLTFCITWFIFTISPFWVLPSLVILTHLEHKTRFYLTRTTGAWTTCYYWNCSLNANSTILCFTMSNLFPLSCSCTDYALYFMLYKNSEFLSDILRKSLSSIHCV
jgi:hypothetical protein